MVSIFTKLQNRLLFEDVNDISNSSSLVAEEPEHAFDESLSHQVINNLISMKGNVDEYI